MEILALVAIDSPKQTQIDELIRRHRRDMAEERHEDDDKWNR